MCTSTCGCSLDKQSGVNATSFYVKVAQPSFISLSGEWGQLNSPHTNIYIYIYMYMCTHTYKHDQ